MHLLLHLVESTSKRSLGLLACMKKTHVHHKPILSGSGAVR